jgi:hypothetical protein
MLKIHMVTAAILLLVVVFISSMDPIVHHITFAQVEQQQRLTSPIPESSQWNSSESSSLESPPPSQSGKAGTKVPNQYIVVLRAEASKTPSQAAEDAKDKGAQVLHVYENALKGFAIRVPNEQVLEAIIKNNPNVDYVEQDTTVKTLGQTD